MDLNDTSNSQSFEIVEPQNRITFNSSSEDPIEPINENDLLNYSKD